MIPLVALATRCEEITRTWPRQADIAVVSAEDLTDCGCRDGDCRTGWGYWRHDCPGPPITRARRCWWARCWRWALVTAACTSEPPPDPATGPRPADRRLHLRLGADNPDAAADFTSDPAQAVADARRGHREPAPGRADASPPATSPAPSQDTATVTATIDWDARTRGLVLSGHLDLAARVGQRGLAARLVADRRASQTRRTADAGDPDLRAEQGVMVDRNNSQIVVAGAGLLGGADARPRCPTSPATAAALAAILSPLDPTITADSIVAGAAGGRRRGRRAGRHRPAGESAAVGVRPRRPRRPAGPPLIRRRSATQ